MNLAQLVNRADGKIDRLHDPIVTNLARLVQTLDQDGDGGYGVTIAPIVHELVEPMVINFNQADTDAAKVSAGAASSGPTTDQMVSFAGDQMVTFASDPAVTELLGNSTPRRESSRRTSRGASAMPPPPATSSGATFAASSS